MEIERDKLQKLLDSFYTVIDICGNYDISEESDNVMLDELNDWVLENFGKTLPDPNMIPTKDIHAIIAQFGGLCDGGGGVLPLTDMLNMALEDCIPEVWDMDSYSNYTCEDYKFFVFEGKLYKWTIEENDVVGMGTEFRMVTWDSIIEYVKDVE